MSTPVFGIIAPHPPIMIERVGGSRTQATRTSLDRLAEVAEALDRFGPETVVVMSPHAPVLADALSIDSSQSFTGSLAQFGDATLSRFSGDPELAFAIGREFDARSIPWVARDEDDRLAAGRLDHGTLVPLGLVDPHQRRKLVVLSPAFLPYEAHRAAGAAIRAAADTVGRRVAFIASGDLSHRLTADAPAGYSPHARELDAEIVGLVELGRLAGLMDLDPELVEEGGECGLRSIITLGGYCCEDPVPTRLLAYEGPWGVGYLSALVGRRAVADHDAVLAATKERSAKGGSAGADESSIVRLAREAIDAAVTRGAAVADPSLPEKQYPNRAGAFVSLHLGGKLRGCIGTILPTRNTLAEEVAANAVEAALHDPRFDPVTAEELPLLDVKVDVLHEPEACELEDLDTDKYGVIVSSGWRRGLLLPDLEGVDDVEEQVRIAMAKAGIRADEPCRLERFQVDRYT